MTKILESFPDFKTKYEEHLMFWKDSNERTIGHDMDSFLDYISEKLENKKEYNFEKVFDVIEQMIVCEDKDLSYATSMHFLENLLNHSGNGYFPIESFFPYLGKESKAFCKANEEFWGIENSKFYEDK